MSFDALHSEPEEFVGRTIEVDGNVLFEVLCAPPPEGGQAGPCSLKAYLASEDVTYLGPSEVRDSFALTEGGALISCVDASGTGRCPGWADGPGYRLVATVGRLVLGGRETNQISLDVVTKAPL